MIYAVLFEDNPEVGGDVRQQFMAEHLAFLERHSAAISAAGPLLSTEGKAEGGLWLVEAEDRAAVDALVKEDPFWPTGLRHSVRIMGWKQVFAGGKRC